MITPERGVAAALCLRQDESYAAAVLTWIYPVGQDCLAASTLSTPSFRVSMWVGR
jgi:hypothetical protein